MSAKRGVVVGEQTRAVMTAMDKAAKPLTIMQLVYITGIQKETVRSALNNGEIKRSVYCDRTGRARGVQLVYSLTSKGHCEVAGGFSNGIRELNTDAINLFFKVTKERIGEIYC